jgi:AraC family transcriptional regulator
MIARALPNPDSFKDVAPATITNQVIHTSTTAKYHYPAHTTPHLFVANFKNTGNYRVNDRPVFANDKFFHFLNPGDRLEINFKNSPKLETLLIQFNDQFINDWLSYKRAPEERLIDDLEVDNNDNWSIPSVPFEYSAGIRHLLPHITTARPGDELEAWLFELMESFWLIKEESHRDLNKIAAKRKATREEIYRRLVLAQDFMHDNFNISPTINRIASEACLDKFHFLKLYKNRYGITPHQYLVKLKLEHARDLLLTGNYSVFEACNVAGFESQGTFTNLFKRYFGMLPSQIKCNSQY